MNTNKIKLSIVVPLYNEEKIIDVLCDKFLSFKNELPKNTELVFVDDGSYDDTLSKLKNSLIKNTYKVKIIILSRNFGHQSALLAGLRESAGDITVTMDGDLQHPIELIPKMLILHKKGIDVVSTMRKDTNSSFFKRLTSKCFYSLFQLISTVKINPNLSDFRSMNRTSLNHLLSLPESRKFLRGMVYWIGFSNFVLPYNVEKRFAGESKYTIRKMLRLSLHGITSFSSVPLYFSVFLTAITLLFSISYIIYILYMKIFMHNVVTGWTSLILVILIMNSLVFLLFSLFGIYLAAIYDEVKNRPNYIIKKNINLS